MSISKKVKAQLMVDVAGEMRPLSYPLKKDYQVRNLFTSVDVEVDYSDVIKGLQKLFPEGVDDAS